MKLLLAADIFPPQSGGPATYVVTLANECMKNKIGTDIVSLNPDSDRSAVSCPVYCVSSHHKFFRYFQYVLLLWKRAKIADAIYAMGPVNAGFPAFLAAKLRGKKFAVKVVGDYAWEQGQVSGAVKDSIEDFQKKKYSGKIGLLKKVEVKIAQRADAVIVPCVYVKNMVAGWGVDAKKIHVIYNEAAYTPAVPIQHPGERWVVSVGRLMPWKGMDTLIEVVSDISKQSPESNWKLKIVGDGPEMERLIGKVADMDGEGIAELTGNLSKDTTVSYIASADVFILNSGYEGLAHVLVEAHNQGVPVLASNAGGNSEVVSIDDLFEYNNKAEIKEKILRESFDLKRRSIPHSVRGGITGMVRDTKTVLEHLCASS